MYIRTNIVLDKNKLKAAREITHLETARDIVDYALGRLTKTAQAFADLKKLKGKIRFSKSYNYKDSR